MRPDDPIRLDRRRQRATGDDATVEAALAALGAELEAAGVSARVDAWPEEAPAPIWSAALRGRLVDRLPRPEPWAVPVANAALASESGRKPDSPRTVEPAAPPAGVRALPASTKPWALQLLGRTAWQGPRPRSTPLAGLALAAAVAVVAFLGVTELTFPSAPQAIAGASVNASLVRDGAAGPLTPGTELRAGDAILTAAHGGATLRIGGGEARVASEAALRIVALGDGSVTLEQVTGRAYHRVALPAGGRYVVATGSVRWVAEGTAFDLGRETTPGGGERATLLAIEHDVAVRGDELAARVVEGSLAVVTLTEGAPEAVVIEPVESVRLDDPWLLANARADLDLGFDVGVLAARLEAPVPTPTENMAQVTQAPAILPPGLDSPAPDASSLPAAGPAGSPAPTAKATPKPTPKPTAKATPRPTPKPTPKPMPALSLSLTGCHGGVLLEWSQYDGGGFDHYTTLRSTGSSIPKAYPPEGGAVDPGSTYTTDETKTSAFDKDAEAGQTAYYRAMAFDAEDDVIAASSVESAVPKAVKDLGALDVSGTAAGLDFAWSAYGGPGACFDYYKLVYSVDDPTPSYLAGAPYLAALESQDASSAEGLALDPGTYHFRLQAIKATALGKALVAQSDVTTFTVDP